MTKETCTHLYIHFLGGGKGPGEGRKGIIEGNRGSECKSSIITNLNKSIIMKKRRREADGDLKKSVHFALCHKKMQFIGTGVKNGPSPLLVFLF